MTNEARRLYANAARRSAQDAVVRLDVALADIETAIGKTHDAAIAVAKAIEVARIAVAKLDLMIKRIPA